MPGRPLTRVWVLGGVHRYETACGVWIDNEFGEPTAAGGDQQRCRRCLTVQDRGRRPYFPPHDPVPPGDVVDLDQ